MRGGAKACATDVVGLATRGECMGLGLLVGWHRFALVLFWRIHMTGSLLHWPVSILYIHRALEATTYVPRPSQRTWCLSTGARHEIRLSRRDCARAG